MLNIDKIISDYLKNDSTDYAILINGGVVKKYKHPTSIWVV